MGGLEVIASIASIASTIAGVINTAMSMFREIEIPRIEIPKADLAKINQAIMAQKGLSDQARRTIQQALQYYNQGRLLPQYQARLDEWWEKQARTLQQRLAAAGLENSSIAQSAWAELSRQYGVMAGDFLRAQLADALQLAGLSTEYIRELMSKLQLELGAQQAALEAYVRAFQLAQQQALLSGLTSGQLMSSLSDLTIPVTRAEQPGPSVIVTAPPWSEGSGLIFGEEI